MLVYLLLLLGLSASAENIETIESKILSIKSKILNDSSRGRKIMGGLYSLRQNMKKNSKERAEYETQIFALNSSIKTMTAVMGGLRQSTSEKRKSVRDRIIAMYKLGGRGLLGTIMGSSSSSELDRNIRILNAVVSNDVQLLSTYRDNIDLMEFKKRAIEQRLSELDKKRLKVKALANKLAKQSELKRRIVRSLKRSRSSQLKRLAGYRDYLQHVDMSQNERNILRTLLNPTILEKKGALAMPVKGTVFKKYGIHVLPGNNVRVRNKGLFLSTEQGEQVRSVFAGDVVFAKAFPRFTMTVIVDHGSNYFSVYSNLKRAEVSEGDVLSEGQVVGTVGYHALYQKTGLHFEIRYFSDPLDPSKWIDQKKNMKISAFQIMKDKAP